LVPAVGLAARKPLRRQRRQALRRKVVRVPAERGTSEDAAHVRIDDRHLRVEREASDRVGGVLAESG